MNEQQNLDNNLPLTRRDYSSAAAYAQEVHKWCQSVRCWIAYQQMLTWNYHQWQQQQIHQQLTSNSMRAQQSTMNQPQRGITLQLDLARIFRSADVASGMPQTIIVQQHTIPSFFRRIAAEAIDSVILFVFKLMLVYLLVEFDKIELDQFERILSSEADLQTLIDVTQGLFNIELICKLFAAIIEAFCITFGFMDLPPGCTPGKWMMRLKVISCLDVQQVPGAHNRVAITSLPTISIRSSLLRSVMKNMLTTFLFPLSTAFYMFNYNRAVYDLAAKTIVVNI